MTTTDDLLERCYAAIHGAQTILAQTSLETQIELSYACEALFGPQRHETHYQRLLAEIEALREQIHEHQGW